MSGSAGPQSVAWLDEPGYLFAHAYLKRDGKPADTSACGLPLGTAARPSSGPGAATARPLSGCAAELGATAEQTAETS